MANCKHCVCGGSLVNKQIIEWCGKGRLKDEIEARAAKYTCDRCKKVYWRPYKRKDINETTS